MTRDFKPALVAKAKSLGFDLCRVTSPDATPETAARLNAWLAAGYAGDMDYIAETSVRRASPRALWPDVRSVVMLGTNYAPEGDPLATLAQKDRGNISVYARHRDYHDLIKGRLKQLGSWLAALAPSTELKVFVDTAPVMEKPLAQAAGLGWQGKHTNLVSREAGSWLFLGALFTDLAIEPDVAETDHCGQCRACLDACPTNAFPQPYLLDARRCISYLTIEHKGHIPAPVRAAIGNRIYGCDDCLAACPWNKFAQASREAKLQARADLVAPRLSDLLILDDAGFRAHFSGSPVKRIGSARFARNLLVAAGNSGDLSLLPLVELRLDDPSPLVRAMAVWALWRLAPQSAAALAARHRAREDDADVLAEWGRIEAPVEVMQ
ncbi:tRNA epoxyqueuosine(34) reductase QueG [Methylovirgula ligni]|nr:tRNA epoxyqueuosine(34) reductase QueG [Methylovirgula ligni]